MRKDFLQEMYHLHHFLFEAFKEYGIRWNFRSRATVLYSSIIGQMKYRNYEKVTFQYKVLSQIIGEGLLPHSGGKERKQRRRLAGYRLGDTAVCAGFGS